MSCFQLYHLSWWCVLREVMRLREQRQGFDKLSLTIDDDAGRVIAERWGLLPASLRGSP